MIHVRIGGFGYARFEAKPSSDLLRRFFANPKPSARRTKGFMHAMTNTILAIGFGKFNSVLAHFDPDTRQASVRTANGEYRMVDEANRSVAHASGSDPETSVRRRTNIPAPLHPSDLSFSAWSRACACCWFSLLFPRAC